MPTFARSVAGALVALAISFGVTPPAVSLLEILRAPGVAVVAITKRRRVDYRKLFT
jgi:hypothetical protein